MSLDVNNVSTKFQHYWPANNRIIAGSLCTYFSGSLLCFQTQFQNVGKYSSDVTATKFLYLEDES